MTVNNFFSVVWMDSWSSWPRQPWTVPWSSAGALHACAPRLSAPQLLLLSRLRWAGCLGSGGAALGQGRAGAVEPSPALHLQLELLRTTWGSLAHPWANTRLHVVKLLASA